MRVHRLGRPLRGFGHKAPTRTTTTNTPHTFTLPQIRRLLSSQKNMLCDNIPLPKFTSLFLKSQTVGTEGRHIISRTVMRRRQSEYSPGVADCHEEETVRRQIQTFPRSRRMSRGDSRTTNSHSFQKSQTATSQIHQTVQERHTELQRAAHPTGG